jgi:hypothetical protein
MHRWIVSCRAEPPPLAPRNLAARALDDHSVALTWINDDPGVTNRIERMEEDGERFEALLPDDLDDVSSTGATDVSGQEGVTYLYRVLALLDGEVSAPSDIASATTFSVAFTAPPGTLTREDAAAGFCVVQRLSQTRLAAGGTQVRIVLRGPITGSLTLDTVTISKVDATGDDRYDPADDLTVVASNVTIQQDAAVTVPPNGPVDYTLDATQDLLVAFDIRDGNVRRSVVGGLTGATFFSNSATAEAVASDRTTLYENQRADTLALIEKIMVL